MVLKGANWLQNDKIRSSGVERGKLDTYCKNQVIWSWKESIGYPMIKSGKMVLKGVNREDYDTMRSNGLKMCE